MLEREMDLAEQVNQARIAEVRDQARRAPQPDGLCRYCRDVVDPGLLFCPPEEPGLPGCRDDYEAEQQAKARNGHLA